VGNIEEQPVDVKGHVDPRSVEIIRFSRQAFKLQREIGKP